MTLHTNAPDNTDLRRGRLTEQRAETHGVVKQLALILASFVAVIISLINRDLLPGKFFLDDTTIQLFISGNLSSSGYTAYQTTADLYTLFGLGGHPEIVGPITVLVFIFTVLVALGWGRIRDASGWSIVFACVSIVLSSIYLAQYSKEFWVLALVLVFFITRGKRFGDVAWLATVVLYAQFVREYWFIVAILYVAARILLPRFRRAGWVILCELLAVAALVVGTNVFLGTTLNQARLDSNQNLVIDRASEIRDFIVSSDLPSQYVNGVLILITLLIPIPLLFAGSIVHIGSALLITTLWIATVIGLVRAIRSGQLATNTALASGYAVVLALVTVQMMFEPDYGSYLRHLTPVLPIFLYCMNVRRMQVHA